MKVLLTEAQNTFLFHGGSGLESFRYHSVPEAPMRAKRVTIPKKALYERELGRAEQEAALTWTEHYRPRYLAELVELVRKDAQQVHVVPTDIPLTMAKMVALLPPGAGKKLPEFIVSTYTLDRYTELYALAAMTQREVSWPPTFAQLPVHGIDGFEGILLHRPGAIEVGCASGYVERGMAFDSDMPHLDIHAGYTLGLPQPSQVVYSPEPA